MEGEEEGIQKEGGEGERVLWERHINHSLPHAPNQGWRLIL